MIVFCVIVVLFALVPTILFIFEKDNTQRS